MPNPPRRAVFPASLLSVWVLLACALAAFRAPVQSEPAAVKDPAERARQVFSQAIQAMGGDLYLNVKTEYAAGRDFQFSRDRRSGLIPFQQWTLYEDPVRYRYQIYKGKRQTLDVYNLELNQGWTQEGFQSVEEMPEERIERFRKTVKRDLHYLLRNRLDEEGLSFFYYGPQDIAGSGKLEAVEVIDSTNDAITVYFDIDTHLPVHTETLYTDRLGIRHEYRTEFFNWHEQNGVLSPLSFYTFIDGEKSGETFFEELEYNTPFPPDYFLKPVIPPDKVKKNKKNKKGP